MTTTETAQFPLLVSQIRTGFRILRASLGVVLLAGAFASQAALQARDLNGDTVADAYYDTVLNVTWLRDWNAAAGTNFDDGASSSDGRMTWANANAWAQGLTVGAYSDWRLPLLADIGQAGCDFAYSGSDCGYNVSTSGSELAHLFHATLGNVSILDANGVFRGGSSGVNWGLVHSLPFAHMQSDMYWTQLDFGASTHGGFDLSGGGQGAYGGAIGFAVAVRSGDVTAAVPEPAAVALVVLALGAAGMARRRLSS